MRATSHTCNLRSVLSHDRCRCRICTPDTLPRRTGQGVCEEKFFKTQYQFLINQFINYQQKGFSMKKILTLLALLVSTVAAMATVYTDARSVDADTYHSDWDNQEVEIVANGNDTYNVTIRQLTFSYAYGRKYNYGDWTLSNVPGTTENGVTTVTVTGATVTNSNCPQTSLSGSEMTKCSLTAKFNDDKAYVSFSGLLGGYTACTVVQGTDDFPAGGTDPVDPDEPTTGAIDIVTPGYSPNGSSFVQTASIDWDKQYIKAVIDLSSCGSYSSNENVLSVGSDISAWKVGGFHFYYTKSAGRLKADFLTTDGAHPISAEIFNISGVVEIVFSKEKGFTVNGQQYNIKYDSNNSVIDENWANTYAPFFALSTVEVGSQEGGTRSWATYNSVQVLNIEEAGGTDPEPDPSQGNFIVPENFEPNGAQMSYSTDINWDTQKIVATIDLTNCFNTNENVLSVGVNTPDWANGPHFHFFYTKSTKKLQINYLNANSNLVRRDLTAEGVVTIEISKENGATLNGENINYEYSENNTGNFVDPLTTYSDLWTLNHVDVAANQGSTWSHAKYVSVTLVDLEGGSTEPEPATVYNYTDSRVVTFNGGSETNATDAQASITCKGNDLYDVVLKDVVLNYNGTEFNYGTWTVTDVVGTTDADGVVTINATGLNADITATPMGVNKFVDGSVSLTAKFTADKAFIDFAGTINQEGIDFAFTARFGTDGSGEPTEPETPEPTVLNFTDRRVVTLNNYESTVADNAQVQITSKGNDLYDVVLKNIVNVYNNVADNYGDWTITDVPGTTDDDGVVTISATGLNATIANANAQTITAKEFIPGTVNLTAKFNADKAYVDFYGEIQGFWGRNPKFTVQFGTDDFGGTDPEPVDPEPVVYSDEMNIKYPGFDDYNYTATVNVYDQGEGVYDVEVASLDYYTMQYGALRFNGLAGEVDADGYLVITGTDVNAVDGKATMSVNAKAKDGKLYMVLEGMYHSWGTGVATFTFGTPFESGETPEEPSEGVDIIEPGYAPNGASFVETTTIDWNTQYVKAVIDLSTCGDNNANENVFSIGNDISKWQVGGFHFYYTKYEKKLKVDYLSSAWEHPITAEISNVEGVIELVFSKNVGFTVNGEQYNFKWNNGPTDEIDENWANTYAPFFALTNIEVGSQEGATRSYATYNSVKILTLEAEPLFSFTDNMVVGDAEAYETTVKLYAHENEEGVYDLEVADLVYGDASLGTVRFNGVSASENATGYMVLSGADIASEDGTLTMTVNGLAKDGKLFMSLTGTYNSEITMAAKFGEMFTDYVVAENLQPNGAEFMFSGLPIDWEKEGVKAVLDLTACDESNNTPMKVFALGTDATEWTNNIHIYYYAGTKVLQAYCDMADGMGNNNTGQFTLDDYSNVVITVDKEKGLAVNGETKIAARRFTELLNLETIAIGAIGGSDLNSSAVYSTICYYPLEAEEPFDPVVTTYENKAFYQFSLEDYAPLNFEEGTTSFSIATTATEGVYNVTITNLIDGEGDSAGNITFEATGVTADGVTTYTAEQQTVYFENSDAGWTGYPAGILGFDAKEENGVLTATVMIDYAGSYYTTLQFGEDPTTGISSASAEKINLEGAEFFTVNGAKVNGLQKGINIVRTADGKTFKVVKK